MRSLICAASLVASIVCAGAEPPAPRTFDLGSAEYVDMGYEMSPYYGLPTGVVQDTAVETRYETEDVPVTRNVTEWVEEEKVVKVKVPVTRQETVMVPRTVKVTTIRQTCCQPQVVSTSCCQQQVAYAPVSVQPVIYKRATFQRRAARQMQRRAKRYATQSAPQYMSACPNGQCNLAW